LKEDLEERIKSVERLRPKSPLIAHEKGMLLKNHYMKKAEVYKIPYY